MRYLKVVQLMAVISDAQDFKDGYMINIFFLQFNELLKQPAKC